MKTSKLILFVFLIFKINASYGQVFSDYLTIENPINDDKIIGKLYNKGIFSGIGTDAFLVSDGNSSITSKDTTKFKIAIQAVIGKIVSGDVGLSHSKITVSNLNNIQIKTCTDFSQIYFASGKGEYVVSAIEIGSFDISTSKGFGADLQAKLNFQIGQSLTNVNPTVSYNNGKATVKLGTNLVIAIKRLRIVKNEAYIDNISILKDSKATWNDQFTNKDNTIFFASMPTLDAKTFTTDDDISDNKGIFYLWFTDSAVPDPTANGQSISRSIIVAPKCSEMKSIIKPKCDDYNPNPLYQSINMKQVVRSSTSTYVVKYELSVNNLAVNYDKEPRTGRKFSNYSIDNATGDVQVRKDVYYYKLLD